MEKLGLVTTTLWRARPYNDAARGLGKGGVGWLLPIVPIHQRCFTLLGKTVKSVATLYAEPCCFHRFSEQNI